MFEPSSYNCVSLTSLYENRAHAYRTLLAFFPCNADRYTRTSAISVVRVHQLYVIRHPSKNRAPFMEATRHSGSSGGMYCVFCAFWAHLIAIYEDIFLMAGQVMWRRWPYFPTNCHWGGLLVRSITLLLITKYDKICRQNRFEQYLFWYGLCLTNRYSLSIYKTIKTPFVTLCVCVCVKLYTTWRTA